MSAPKKQWLSKEHEQALKTILVDTWQYIGNDIMDAVIAEGKHRISGSDLIEIVLDADHMKAVIRTAEGQQAYAMFNQMSYDDKKKFAKTVFPERWYA